MTLPLGLPRSRVPGHAWVDASTPWILHTVDFLGNLTDGWIDVQVTSQRRFDFRLLGLSTINEVDRAPHWLLASDRRDYELAYRGMRKSRGRSMWLITKALADNPPSVIHAHYGTAAAYHGYFARSLDAPLVASFYGYDATMTWIVKSRAWQRRYRRLFSDVAVVLVEGPAMATRLAHLGCPEGKIRIVRLPANEAGLARCRRCVPDGTGPFTVVAPGWFNEKKGHDTSIKAFARALRGRDALLVMLGAGDREPLLRELARAEGVSRQVEWPGSLPFSSFMSRIARASVAVYASRTAADGDSDGGAPVTLIESQWLGVPSLISEHDDLPFIAPPGAAISLPPRDIDSWAEALLELYDNPDRLIAMGREARTFARLHHSPQTTTHERETIYASI